ncbi:MAG: PKD domain-containing protein [Candidatus Zixiibacteriota bacterium]
MPPQAVAADVSPAVDQSAGQVSTKLTGDRLQDAMLLDPARAKAIALANGTEWCHTQIVYDQRIAALNGGALACPPVGNCDLPGVRDDNIPVADDPPMVIRLKINVFRNDDGSNPAATQAGVDAQIEQLNSDFLPSRIQFEYETEFINSSAFRQFSDVEEGGMKSAFADRPDSMLNVYVVNILAGYLGVGTFPWDPVALSSGGGTIVDDNWFGVGQKTLTHEIGHCVGLWHTHHGVSEVTACGACYERADGAEGDITGDRCSDTDPTPTNFNCGGPGGVDACSATPWGPTDPQNYMGYAPDACYTEFSPHQWGRMQCWSNDVLSSWQSGVSFTGDTTFGPAPLAVQFEPTTNKTVNTWTWDFGDGAQAAIPSPQHVYADPGARDVHLSIEAVEGTYASLRRDYIAVYADTMVGVDAEASPGSTVRMDVTATNFLPLSQVRIPFQWSGPLNLLLDSVVTTGLRTELLGSQGFTDIDPFNKRGTYTLTANIAGGAPPLAPGAGPVISLYFTVPADASGRSNSIPFVSYGVNSPAFVYGSRSYAPVLGSGSINMCAKAGDPGGDGSINIADITYLIAFLFASGPEPVPVINAGDANCSGQTNIADITFLITMIFAGGPQPCVCAP